MDVLELATTAENQIFDVLETIEQLALDGVTMLAGAVEPVAEVPFAATFTSQIASQLPAPADVIDHAYNLAERVLRNQRAFAHKLLEAAGPVTAPKAPPATAPKTASKPKPSVVSEVKTA